MDDLQSEARINSAAEQLRARAATRHVPPVHALHRRRRRGRVLRGGVASAAVVVAVMWAFQDLPEQSHRVAIAPGAQPTGRTNSQTEAASSWVEIPSAPSAAGLDVDAVWAGTKMLVWTVAADGAGDTSAARLLAYSPPAATWERLADPPVVPGGNRNESVATWTGKALIVYGQDPESRKARLAEYRPRTDRWRLLPQGPDLTSVVASPIWTGRELLVWGGVDHAGPGVPAVGAVYHPQSGEWEAMPPAPVPTRQWHTTTWTGTEMIVWGGTDLVGDDMDDGAAYNPVTKMWRTLADAPIAGRVHHDATWTGDELVILGGSSGPSTAASAAAYDPATDTWRTLPPLPVKGRYDTEAVWTGEYVVVWGGYDYYGGAGTLGDGAFYNPASDSWTRLPAAPLGARCHPQLVAYGGGVIVYGGRGDCDEAHRPLRDGAVLRLPDQRE